MIGECVFPIEEHGGVNIQDEDNTPMEEDDNVPEDMIEQDGIGAGDEEAHDDGTSAFDNDDEDGLDIPLLEKACEPLYEGSQTTLLSAIVLLVNLKGYEWFIQYSNVTYAKVCHFCHLQC